MLSKSVYGTRRRAISTAKPGWNKLAAMICCKPRLIIFTCLCISSGPLAWAGSTAPTPTPIETAVGYSLNDTKSQQVSLPPPVGDIGLVTPFLPLPGTVKCAGQLSDTLDNMEVLGLATEGTAKIADITAWIAELAAKSTEAGALTTKSVAEGAETVALATEDGVANPSPAIAEGVVTGATGTEAGATTAESVALAADMITKQADLQGLVESVNAAHYKKLAGLLPDCNQQFKGTVEVTAGGTNVTGNSVFNNNLGVAGNLIVGDNNGITIGGGEISGTGRSGVPATTNNVDAIAIGNGANATSATSTALGTSANANSINSTAIGSGSTATGDSATAIGQGSQAVGSNSTAIGAGAVAIGNNSVALGQGSAAVEDNTVSVGNSTTGMTRRITNVAPGIAPTDAVNVEQFLAGLGALNAELSSRIDQTGAISSAMSEIQLPRGAYNGLGVGLGTQGGQSAIAFGLIGTISPNMLIKVTAGNSGQETNVAAGLTLGW